MIHVPRRHAHLVYPRRSLPPAMLGRMSIQGIVKRVELVNVRTGLVELSLPGWENLIVDAGLNGLGDGTLSLTNMIQYLAVGTDNTTPAAVQTSLIAQLGTRSNSNGGFADVIAFGPANAYIELTRTRVIAAGVATGNLTEFGFFSAAASGTMWTRQLFLAAGIPTTITKAADQELRVIYAWRIYPQQTEATTQLTINSVLTDCTTRSMDIDNDAYWGSGGAVKNLGGWTTSVQDNFRAYETDVFPTLTGGDFTGTPANASSVAYQAYVAGNFYRDVDIIFEPGVANFATGIGALAFTPWGTFSRALGVKFSPKIGKDSTYRFTFRARIAWARH